MSYEQELKTGKQCGKHGLARAALAGVFALFSLLMFPANSFSGTYTSTMHGQLADRSVVGTTPWPYTTKGLCDQCHMQHSSINGSVPTPPAAAAASKFCLFEDDFGANKNQLCFACHEQLTINTMPKGYGMNGFYQGQTKYANSIHSLSANMLWPKTNPSAAYSDAGNCINCHNPHGYKDSTGLVPHMLIARDSKYGDSPAYEMTCEGCHDGSVTGAHNIQAELSKAYAHPTHLYNNRHSINESGTTGFGQNNRHAECVDCHNPHALSNTGAVHTPGTTGNAVSGVLQNEWGVQPTWPTIWTQPTTFTVYNAPTYPNGASYEYQICFKCHSGYGIGTVTGGVASWTGTISSNNIASSGWTVTDQAWEFNPNNKSAHPVVNTLNNQTGSYAPKALTAAQMLSPWTNVGNQTMYCSDCHGADDENTGGAVGPHGSTYQYMLKGTNGNNYWPANSSGTLYTLQGSQTSISFLSGLLCLNCHPVWVASGGTSYTHWLNKVHGEHAEAQGLQNVACVLCHIVVPHGSEVSRLIVYQNMGAPYLYQGTGPKNNGSSNYGYLLGFKKASGPLNYSPSNCYTTSAYQTTGSGDACKKVHGMSMGGYD